MLLLLEGFHGSVESFIISGMIRFVFIATYQLFQGNQQKESPQLIHKKCMFSDYSDRGICRNINKNCVYQPRDTGYCASQIAWKICIYFILFII